MVSEQAPRAAGNRSISWRDVTIGFVAGAVAVAGALLMWFSSARVDGTAGATSVAGPSASGTAGPPASPVEVVPAVKVIAAEPVQLLGTVAPIRESLVASETEGLVVGLSVDEGDTVARGQVLARLRRSDLQQQLAAAKAAKEETQARQKRAETDLSRLEQLRVRKAISEREYDQAVADRDALARAVARLEAELARLQDQLDRTAIRAPFSGQVIAVQTEVGEWVGRGDAIVSLVDLSQVDVQVQIAERYVSAVHPGFEVAVRFDALPGREAVGRVVSVVPQAVPEARTFPVLVRIPNPDLAIKGGMAARVLAQLGSPEPAVLVSKDALVRRNDQVLVFRVRPDGARGTGDSDAVESTGAGDTSVVGTLGRIEQVSVVTGPPRGDWQVVYGGVQAGDLVVVRGNERVFPGQPVKISRVREPDIPSADPNLPIAVDPRQ